MTGKNAPNKVIKEELDNLSSKFKELENVVVTLRSKLEEKDIQLANLELQLKDRQSEDLTCKTCVFICQRRKELKHHKLNNHSDLVSKQKCNICDMSFIRNIDHEIHLKGHSEASTFDCEQCDNTFYLKWRLDKHAKVHYRN